MPLLDHYNLLIEAVQEIDGVLSIGKSGGENIPKQNESDIDIFIFCSKSRSYDIWSALCRELLELSIFN